MDILSKGEGYGLFLEKPIISCKELETFIFIAYAEYERYTVIFLLLFSRSYYSVALTIQSISFGGGEGAGADSR